MLNLGAHARKILQTQKFRIPKVDSVVTEKFLGVLSNCILDDALNQLQKAEDSAELDSVASADGMIESLDDSEVARKVNKKTLGAKRQGQ